MHNTKSITRECRNVVCFIQANVFFLMNYAHVVIIDAHVQAHHKSTCAHNT